MHLLLERKAASRRPDSRFWVCHQNSFAEKHACATVGINERLMKLRISFSRIRYWDLQGSGPWCPWGLPRCPSHCLGGGNDARRLLRRYEKKGSKSDCGNCRGISLLSVTGKIFARVILNRRITVSEQTLPEAQCSFWTGRSTVDMIFAVTQLQEKCIEQNKPIYSVFIDLTKAFDTVNREALWTILERIECLPKLVSMIRLFHDVMTGQVLSNGNVTDAFVISNGVKQGCVLGPVLFNVFFTCMLSYAVQDLEKGVYIRYRLDRSFFDLRRLTAKTKSLQTLLQEVLFADDCALVAHAEQNLQRMLDRFSEASKLLGKMEVLHQPAPYSCPSPTITIDDKQLANVEHFKYLGSTISCDGSRDREFVTRISKASELQGSLPNRVFSENNIRLSTKLKVYNAVVLPFLLYGCDMWTLCRMNIKKLELFHMRFHPGNQVAGPHKKSEGPQSS